MDSKETQLYAQPGTTRYTRIRLGIFLTGLSVFAQLYLFQPILGSVAEYFAVEASASSLAVSLSTIGMACGLFLFVFRADIVARKTLMSASLLVSALLTLGVSTISCLPLFLSLCFLRGLVLSGVSAVALAYLAEEIDPRYIGLGIAIYLSGNNVGGMLGRVGSSLAADWQGWQASAVGIGFLGLIVAVVFLSLFPNSRNFKPIRIPARLRLQRMKGFLRSSYFLSLYATGFLFMGAFVSVYNFVSFRLLAPPFSLPPVAVSFLYILFVTGVVSSLLFGRWSDRYSSKQLLLITLTLFALGIVLLATPFLSTVLLGLALVTLSFFASHTITSRMVSTQAGVGKSSATCLYWLFYYLGASAVGYLAGLVYFAYGWTSFTLLLFGMLLLAITLVFYRVPQEFHGIEGMK